MVNQRFFPKLPFMTHSDERMNFIFVDAVKAQARKMHSVFVEQYGTFPTSDYEFWKRTRFGWVLYRRKDGI